MKTSKQIISKVKFDRIVKDKPLTICFVKYTKEIPFISDDFYEIVTGVYHNGVVATETVDKHGETIYVNCKVFGFLKEY